MNEIEVKIINIDVKEIREKMQAINAPKVKEENQINYIFDFPDGRLISDRGYARIRVVADILHNDNVCYMTTKKMLSQEKYKIMDECETEIKDAVQGENIFKSLGLELISSIKKFRESYKYKNTLIEIDINDKSFCPFPYIEIESENEKELLEVVNLLGYTIEDTTSKTIHEILKDKSIISELY